MVDRWLEEEIEASDVADLHLIGSEAGGRWDELTGGTYRIRDASRSPPSSPFHWDPRWVLVAIRDPETGERVPIDGNERALQVHAGVQTGALRSSDRVSIITGDRNLLVIRIAKAVLPLWR